MERLLDKVLCVFDKHKVRHKGKAMGKDSKFRGITARLRNQTILLYNQDLSDEQIILELFNGLCLLVQRKEKCICIR